MALETSFYENKKHQDSHNSVIVPRPLSVETNLRELIEHEQFDSLINSVVNSIWTDYNNYSRTRWESSKLHHVRKKYLISPRLVNFSCAPELRRLFDKKANFTRSITCSLVDKEIRTPRRFRLLDNREKKKFTTASFMLSLVGSQKAFKVKSTTSMWNIRSL